MDPERYAEVKVVFRAACEHAPENRPAFLDERCAGDSELRAEVESLLDHAGTEGNLGTATADGRRSLAREERFLPGTLIAKRYRIVGLIGRGGMGEVYRADDVALAQTVALKFLPPEVSNDPRWLERLRNEVRLARQVTHPNVCRIYDLHESEELAFLSMEYVDGEDMTSLQRRIGRLPFDKACQVARQLCLGLAAAHDRGVLHRDLKPANIMLDGHGHVRVTDFGVAALAVEGRAEEDVAGTPAYMAPEQIARGESTPASDVYSLGLVLYELFAGRHPFQAASIEEYLRLHQEESPPTPSELAPDVDPEVERILVLCLEKDPNKRPASARAVAAALPGGPGADLLHDAVARGETPSPELVAAAGPLGGMRLAPAAACLGVFLACLVVATFLTKRSSLIPLVGLEKSREVLRDRAETIAAELGFTRVAADTEAWFQEDPALLARVADGPAPVRWERLGDATGAIRYWYRSFATLPHFWPYALASRRGAPAADDLVTLSLDPRGRLTSLRARSPADEEGDGLAGAAETDWSDVFGAAGLDFESFTRVSSGDLEAWEGASPDDPATRLRAEGRARAGRPVAFNLNVHGVDPLAEGQLLVPHTPKHEIETLITILLTVVGVIWSWANLRRGRGDRRGAIRLAAFVFLAHTFRWLMVGKHSTDLSVEYSLFLLNTGFHLFIGFQILLFYLTLEPYLRKHWPTPLIPWSRLLSGRFRDPLVARTVLVGLASGGVITVLHLATAWLPSWRGPLVTQFLSTRLENLGGPARAAAVLIHEASGSLFLAIVLLFTLAVLRLVLRNERIAGAVWVIVIALGTAGIVSPEPATVEIGYGLAVAAVSFWLIARFGMLAVASAFYVQSVFVNLTITFDSSAWYFTGSVTALGTLALLGIWAFRTAVAVTGRPFQ